MDTQRGLFAVADGMGGHGGDVALGQGRLQGDTIGQIDGLEGAVEPGDVFVLCSDGLTDPVDEAGRSRTSSERQTAPNLRRKRYCAPPWRQGGRITSRSS